MTVLDAPTKARTKIATFMHVLCSERLAGNPGVTTGFGFNLRCITFHENRVYSFAHSPVDGSSFEKQNTADQTATRRPVCILFFWLGVDRPM